MRIRWRLALYGAAVIAGGMLIFGILLTWLANAAAPADQDKALIALVEQTVVLAENSDELIPGAAVVPVELTEENDAFIAVLRSDGSVVYSTGVVNGAAPQIPAAAIVEANEAGESILTYDAGTELRIVARPWSNDGGSGIAVAGQPTAALQEQLAGLTFVIWAAAILALIAAVVVSWLVAGRALRPLRELATTTDEIGATGDLSRRLPAVAAKDEVGALTQSFNAMLERVESAQNQLSQTLDTQRRFVADASHELRSPLTTIRNNAGFLTEHPDAADTDRTEAVDDIAAEADRMTRLVDDLLTLARADAGEPMARVPVALDSLVSDTARRAKRHGIQLATRTSGAVIVEGDPDALSRLLWILVDNAAKHGGGDVTVALRSLDRSAVLHVADTGPGIPEGDLGTVFERFYRSDPARSPAGVGLGLAIAAQIARDHEGAIKAVNRDDGGALFQVTLPLSEL